MSFANTSEAPTPSIMDETLIDQRLNSSSTNYYYSQAHTALHIIAPLMISLFLVPMAALVGLIPLWSVWYAIGLSLFAGYGGSLLHWFIVWKEGMTHECWILTFREKVRKAWADYLFFDEIEPLRILRDTSDLVSGNQLTMPVTIYGAKKLTAQDGGQVNDAVIQVTQDVWPYYARPINNPTLKHVIFLFHAPKEECLEFKSWVVYFKNLLMTHPHATIATVIFRRHILIEGEVLVVYEFSDCDLNVKLAQRKMVLIPFSEKAVETSIAEFMVQRAYFKEIENQGLKAQIKTLEESKATVDEVVTEFKTMFIQSMRWLSDVQKTSVKRIPLKAWHWILVAFAFSTGLAIMFWITYLTG